MRRDKEHQEAIISSQKKEILRLRKEVIAKNNLIYKLSKCSLTNLPHNREVAEEDISKAVDNAHRHEEAVVLMFIDVNDLKNINDIYGHKIGDIALREIASSINSVLRTSDLLYRWGGDEFLAVISLKLSLSEKKREEYIRNLYLRIKTVVEKGSFTISEDTVSLSVSIGYSFLEFGRLINEAIEQADTRMYIDKAQKNNPQ